MRKQVSNFDRFWNSTFGLPQQLLFRLLRVIQDDRVDLFSRQGLLDMSLIPVLGIFDSDRYDVDTEEKVQRLLGVKKPNLAQSIGVEVLTDPLTYLTGGLTAGGKMAAAATKASRVRPVANALKEADELNLTVGAFKGHIKDALAHKGGLILDREQRAVLEKSLAELHGADDGANFSKVMTEAGKREIQVGLPILNGYGAVLYRNQAYDGWTKLLLNKTKTAPIVTSLVEGTKGMVSSIPGVNKALENAGKSWQVFRDGVKTSGEDLRVFEAGDAIRQAPRALTDTNREVYLHLQSRGVDQIKRRYANAVAESEVGGVAPWEAIREVFGKKITKQAGSPSALWEEITGKPLTEVGLPTPEAFNKQVDAFMSEYRETVDAYKTGSYTDELTPAGKLQEKARELGKLNIFERGRRLGEVWRHVFESDIGKKAFLEPERHFRGAVAAYQQAVEERVRLLAPLRAKAAAEIGMSPQEFDARVLKLHEANAMQDELQDRLLALTQNPQSKEAAQSLEDYAARFIHNLSNLRKLALGGKANPFDKSILEALEPVFKEGVRDGDTLTAVMDGLHQSLSKWAPELSASMDSYGSAQLLTGSRRGRHLQFINDAKLRKEETRLLKRLESGELPLSRKAAESAMIDLPEMQKFITENGLLPEQAVEILRSSARIEKTLKKAEKAAVEMTGKAAHFEALDELGHAASNAADEAGSRLRQYAQTENKELTRQWGALNTLESVVGEWKDEVGHIKEQLAATRKVGKRAGKAWEAAFTEPLPPMPKEVEDLFNEFGKAHSVDREGVQDLLKQYHGSGEKKFETYMPAHGNVPVKASDLEDLMQKLEARLERLPSGEVDMERFLVARKAVGGEAQTTRELGELLKTREAEIAKWSAEIPKLKEDVKALQQEIKEAAKAKKEGVKTARKTSRVIEKEQARVARRLEKVRERMNTLRDQVTAASGQLAHGFGVSSETVGTVVSRANQIKNDAMRVVHSRDLRNVRAVIQRRKEGKTMFVPQPRPRTVRFPAGARTPQSVELQRAGADVDELVNAMGFTEGQAEHAAAILGTDARVVDTGEAVNNSLALVVMAKEMKRAAAAGTAIPPTLHRAATEVIQRNSDLMEKAFYGAAGEAGKTYIQELEKVRQEIHAASAEAGLLTAGSPIAYAPRVKGFKESQLLDQLLDDGEFYQIIDTSMPRLGPILRRERDSITVQDLNTISRALAEASGPKAKQWAATLDRFAEANGYSAGFKEYSEEALLNLMNRFAQNERISTTAAFADSMFSKGEQTGSLIGGHVTRVITAAGDDVRAARTTKFGPAKNRGKTMEVPVEAQEYSRPEIVGIEITTANGSRRLISAETMALHRGSVLSLGRPNFDLMRAKSLEVGDDISKSHDVALAFAHKAARGQVDSGSMLHSIEDVMATVKEGDYVAFGNRDVIANTIGTIQNQWKNFHWAWNTYDMAHHFVKRLQTVYRPAFLGANTAAAGFQSMLAGASPGAAMRGYWHAARFMTDNVKLSAHYDRFAAVSAEAEKGISGVLRGGTEFLRVLRRNPELKNVPWADDVAFRFGGQEVTFREMAPHLRPLLMSTGVREGFRGGSRVSRALTKLAEGKQIEGVLGKTEEVLKTASEEVEIYNRLTTFFALADDGMSFADASKNALAAHVNYADLTSTERIWFKRLFGFYTWTRKMTPYVGKKFLDQPALAARAAAFLRADLVEEDEHGNFYVNAGKFKLAADRFNPTYDTLRLLETVGETMQQSAAAVGVARGADRQEQISGQTRSPLSAGGLTGVLWDSLHGDGQGARNTTENAINTFWLSRIMLGELNGDTDRTVSEQVFEQMIPVKLGNGRERSNRVIQARTARIIGDLKRRAERTDDLDLKDRLYQEITRLQEYSQSIQK